MQQQQIIAAVAYKHCALSGRMRALFELALTDVLNDFEARYTAKAASRAGVNKCIKAHVFAGNKGMSGFSAFPCAFQSVLEDALLAQLRAAGCIDMCAVGAVTPPLDALNVYYIRKLDGACKRAYDEAYANERGAASAAPPATVNAWKRYGDAVCDFMTEAIGVCKDALGARSDKTRSLVAELRRFTTARQRHCATCRHCQQ